MKIKNYEYYNLMKSYMTVELLLFSDERNKNILEFGRYDNDIKDSVPNSFFIQDILFLFVFNIDKIIHLTYYVISICKYIIRDFFFYYL